MRAACGEEDDHGHVNANDGRTLSMKSHLPVIRSEYRMPSGPTGPTPLTQPTCCVSAALCIRRADTGMLCKVHIIPAQQTRTRMAWYCRPFRSCWKGPAICYPLRRRVIAAYVDNRPISLHSTPDTHARRPRNPRNPRPCAGFRRPPSCGAYVPTTYRPIGNYQAHASGVVGGMAGIRSGSCSRSRVFRSQGTFSSASNLLHTSPFPSSSFCRGGEGLFINCMRPI